MGVIKIIRCWYYRLRISACMAHVRALTEYVDPSYSFETIDLASWKIGCALRRAETFAAKLIREEYR